MAWCPKCDGDYPIVTSVTGHPVSVPTVTDRYNASGEYIGYEEGKSFRTDMQTVPRCSRCYSLLECPNATSKEEYFYAKKELVIKRWHDTQPLKKSKKEDEGAAGCVVPVMGAAYGIFFIYWISGSLLVSIIGGILIGIGVLMLWLRLTTESEDGKEWNTPEMKAWQSTLDKLQSMAYSDANYERLKQL